MKFYKIELVSLINYLDGLSLAGKASRMRTKFKNKMLENYTEMMKDIDDIKKEFEGNPDEIEKAYKELMQEQIGIDDNDETNEMLVSLKYSIENDKNEYKALEAQFYDRICELFEEVKDKKTEVN